METKTVILGEPLTVVFPNGRSAQILNVNRDATPEQVLVALGIRPPQAVVVISGGAGNMEARQMRRPGPKPFP